MQVFSVGAETHTGRRPNNEDTYGVDPERGLFIVADGMGGHEGGEVASRLAVDVIQRFFRVDERDPNGTWPFAPVPGVSDVERKVTIGIRLADRAIRTRSEGELERMGATVAVAAFDDEELVLGHVGDTRIYRLRDGLFEQLTRDHSMYNKFLDAGATLPPRAEFPYDNVVTRALGCGDETEQVSPEIRRTRPRPGDLYLLCSDGLTDALPGERIGQLLRERPTNVVSRFLIEEAYELGSTDNITAVVVDVEEKPARTVEKSPSQAPAVGARRSQRSSN